MLWPGSTTSFRRATRKVDLTEYELILRRDDRAAPPAPFAPSEPSEFSEPSEPSALSGPPAAATGTEEVMA